MPKMIQVKVSLADTEQEAIDLAVKDWPNGGMAFPKGDIRNPEDFEIMAKMVEGKHFKNRVLTTADLDKHVEYLQHFIDLGFDEIYQLEGGILRYIEEIPADETRWEGECFVFDERRTLDSSLKQGTGPDYSQRGMNKKARK